MGLKKIILITFIFILSSCGGGGGGGNDSSSNSNTGYGNGYGNNNNSPEITNTTSSYEAQENQSSAFTVTASDADNDTLTFSISGDDANLFSIGSSSGIVSFIEEPDYENASDADSDNVYEITASVTDGTASDSMEFSINVTNDTSDDTSSDNYDGKIIASGPIQSAAVCFVENITDICSESDYKATSLQDGSFSIAVDSNTQGIIKTEGGFDPNTNWQILSNEGFVISQPTISQDFVISPLSAGNGLSSLIFLVGNQLGS